jgi:hypothetical protein
MANLDLSWPTTTDDDGTGQTGTNTKKSFWDSIKSAVEGNLHSAANSTIKTKTIIDEVKEARGTTSSLEDRIDDVITKDGELILPSSVANLSQLREIIGNQNLVRDGSFWIWSYGTVGVDRTAYWERSNAEVTLERCGYGAADTTQLMGQFTMKVTQATGNANRVDQRILNPTDFANADFLKDTYVSAGAWCKASVASAAGLTISDWNQSTTTNHTGGGDWEWLTVTHKISQAGTRIVVSLNINAATSIYWSGVSMVLGATPPAGPLSEKWRKGMVHFVHRGTIPNGVFIKLPVLQPAIIYYAAAQCIGAPSSNMTMKVQKQTTPVGTWVDTHATGTVIGSGLTAGGFLIAGTYQHRCLSGVGGTGRTGGEYSEWRANILTNGGASDIYFAWYFLTINDPLEVWRGLPSEY